MDGPALDSSQRPAISSGPNPEPSSPRGVIDHKEFPHIITAVLEYGGLPAYRAFASTCRAYLERADMEAGDVGTYFVDTSAQTCEMSRTIGLASIPRFTKTKPLPVEKPSDHTPFWWSAVRSGLRLTHVHFSPIPDHKTQGDETIHSDWNARTPSPTPSEIVRRSRPPVSWWADVGAAADAEEAGGGGQTRRKLVAFVNDDGAWAATTRDCYAKGMTRRWHHKDVFVVRAFPVRLEYFLWSWVCGEKAGRDREVVLILPDTHTQDAPAFHHEFPKNLYNLICFHAGDNEGDESIWRCKVTFVNLPADNGFHKQFVLDLFKFAYCDRVQCNAYYSSNPLDHVLEQDGTWCFVCRERHHIRDGNACQGCGEDAEDDHDDVLPWTQCSCMTMPKTITPPEFDNWCHSNLRFLTIDEYRATLPPGEWEEETTPFLGEPVWDVAGNESSVLAWSSGVERA